MQTDADENLTVIGVPEHEFRYNYAVSNLPQIKMSAVFEILQQIHTGDDEEPNVPSDIDRKGLEKVVWTLSRGWATRLVAIAKNTEYSLAEQKYQKVRDDVRRKISKEIAYMFPVSSLLEYNPLREGGASEIFNAFCQNKAKQYLSDLIQFPDDDSHNGRTIRGKNVHRDITSLTKPSLSRLIASPNEWDDGFEEDAILYDINKFKNVQKMRKRVHY